MSALRKPAVAAEAPPPFTVVPKPDAPKPKGLRRVQLDASPEPAKGGTKVYPVLADPDGTIAELAASILRDAALVEALIGEKGKGGSLGLAKAELRALASQQYFSLMQGKGEIPSGIEALTADGRKVRIGFTNKYAGTKDEGPLAAILGDDLAATLLRQKITFKVDCDKVPEDAIGPLYAELKALFAKHKASAALTHSDLIVPTKDFHTLRHTQLTPEQNAAFDKLCPIGVQVKVKGLGNKDED